MTGRHRDRSQNSPGPSEAASEYSLQPIAALGQHADDSQNPLHASEESTPKSGDPEPDDIPPKKQFDWTGSWIWEIGGAALSIICIALLIGFLAYVNGTMYPAWQYIASPNTVVSIIMTVAKSAMLVPVSSCLSQLKWTQYQKPTPLYHMHVLDQASRGPWGALEVLWVFTPSLATAGAILTILSLAIDPFAQQILAYPSHNVVAAKETASVQKAQEYNPSTLSVSFENVGVPLSGDLPAPMQIAIINGLSQTNSPLEPACSSHSCKYPDFVSLGVCSRCEIVTSQVIQTCETTPRWESGMGGPPTLLNHVPINCSYTSPNGLQYVTGEFEGSVQSDPGRVELSRNKWSCVPSNDNDEIFGIKDPIASLLGIRYTQNSIYTPENITEPEPMPEITECGVYLCEKQYTQNHFGSGQRRVQPTRNQPLFVCRQLKNLMTRLSR